MMIGEFRELEEDPGIGTLKSLLFYGQFCQGPILSYHLCMDNSSIKSTGCVFSLSSDLYILLRCRGE